MALRDLDLRYETAFAASPDILELWEKYERLCVIYYKAPTHKIGKQTSRFLKPWRKSERLWQKRYKFVHHSEAYYYWKATRHGP